ncbi:glycosyltransferase family 4 protein [Mangrovibacterium sp.]|uniref:glycosyltransferase family 4 protein n=1 Tax=Mangrovibacterium sp. TaxID=1961364 RepID=UPI0035636562
MVISLVIAFTAALTLTLITTPQIIKVSREKNLFDEPNHRKLNKIVIPNLGGVAIFIGASLSSILCFPKIIPPNIQYVFAGMVLMLFVGLKDDIIGSSPRNKLFMQILAALVLIFMGDLHINNLSNLFFINQIPSWISVPISLLFFLFIINAINLIDGIDGLAAGIGVFFMGTIGFWFYANGNQAYAVISFAFAGALCGFLRFNLFSKKHKIFMGDTGSLILGILIGSLSIAFLNSPPSTPILSDLPHSPSLLLGLLIIPVTDTLRVFYIRVKAGHSPFNPDMNHIHHVLIKSGLSHRVSSLLLVGWSVAMFTVAFVMHRLIPATLSFIFMLALTWLVVNLIRENNNRMGRMRRMRLIVIKNRRKNRLSSFN